jgi:glyoxylase-like metal-dependent hydrolase (beta-lactamase superfamily II)
MFTGGPLDTNAFYYEAPEGFILFDAPMGADEAFADQRIDLLLLTHGHFDHVADAAAIIKRHGCRAGLHPDTLPMVSNREFFLQFGFNLEVEPFPVDLLLDKEEPTNLLGTEFTILHVPGHCPGSICFYQPSESILVGGDVLFRGGVGRTDLPGGDTDLLFAGIRTKLLTLPDNVVVLPGHGPATSIGRERKENPDLAN